MKTLAITAATRGTLSLLNDETKGASAKVISNAMARGRKTSRPKYKAATIATTVATVGNEVRGRGMVAVSPAGPLLSLEVVVNFARFQAITMNIKGETRAK
jgi:hypothetical protein